MAKHNKTGADIIPEELIGGVAETVTPVAPPTARAPELKARVMARIRGKKYFDLLTVRAEEGEWITLLPGLEKKILSKSSDGQMQSYLLRAAPGTTVPPHEHLADEECFMLEGEAMFGDIHLSAGDYHIARKGSMHGQTYTKMGALAFFRSFEPLD
jgi:anti-sigma factor ChrR (cupin superfamily)